ncbi:MAG: HEPN domain-containing protein [Candidatus Acididesulfobacter guangdongensis]|uniref:HEPN domain-containing protein n=1 Tax=Acididesulfobacter guangdongensis TaxID=2597225 RepID=A0A519BHE9_ACIG2|nr:MAG: HEPN domain-containing protein [Candidatus Acididesulfobacter guangdongensis]
MEINNTNNDSPVIKEQPEIFKSILEESKGIDAYNEINKLINLDNIGSIIDDISINYSDETKEYNKGIQKRLNNNLLINNINDCLKDAKIDLRAYNALFKDANYSRAIFNLQQAAEKTIKALCFIMFDKFEPLKIGHSPLTIFNFYFKKEKLFSEMLNIIIKKADAQLKTDMLDVLSKIYDKNYQKDFNINIIKIFLIKDDYNMAGLIIKLLQNIKQKFLNNDHNLNNIFFSSELMIFNLIVSPHENCSRYSGQKIKPENYTFESKIVGYSSGIALELGNIINYIDKLVNIDSNSTP